MGQGQCEQRRRNRGGCEGDCGSPRGDRPALVHFNDGLVLDVLNAGQSYTRETGLRVGTKCRLHAQRAQRLHQRCAEGSRKFRHREVAHACLQLTLPTVQHGGREARDKTVQAGAGIRHHHEHAEPSRTIGNAHRLKVRALQITVGGRLVHHRHRHLRAVHQGERRGCSQAGIKFRAPLAFEINDIRDDRDNGSIICARKNARDQAVGLSADPAIDVGRRARQVAHRGAVVRLVHLGESSRDCIRVQMHPQRIGDGQLHQRVGIEQRSLQRGVVVIQVLRAQGTERQRLRHALPGCAAGGGAVVDDLQRHGDADWRNGHSRPGH
jgi:hypothetical protein